MNDQQYSTETENKIIAAATEVFVQKGRDGARMQEIANRAGINKAMLHYYFRSKDKLYQEVFANEISRFFTSFINSIPDTEDIKEFLDYFIDSYTDYIIEHEELVRFVIWEIQSGAKLMPQQVKNLFRSRGHDKPLFLGLIQKAIDTGQIRPVDPMIFIINLLGLCVYPFIAKPILEQVFAGVELTSAEFVEKRKQEILALIWDGIKPAASEQ